MSTDDYPDDKVVRERVTQRLKPLRRLIVHLVVTVVIAVGLTTAIDQFRLPREAEVVIPLAVFLFIGHTFWLVYAAVRDWITEQELGRYQLDPLVRARAVTSKPKRSQHFLLGDDGELMQVDSPPEDEKAKRQEG